MVTDMKKKRKKISIFNLCLVLSLIFLVSFMTYGFAHYEQLLEFTGTITTIPDGKIEITNISIVDSSNVIHSEIPTFSEDNINFYVTFSGTADSYYITYTADIVNNSSYDYTYNKFELTPVVNSDGGGIGVLSMDITGIEEGRVIEAKTKITINVTLNLDVDDVNQIYNVNGNINMDTEVEDGGELLASLEVLSNNLRGNNEYAEIKLSLINTYSRDIVFRPGSTNTNFYFADENGNKIESLTIKENSTQEFTLYIRISENSYFSSTTDSTVLKLICENINNIIVGQIDLLVDETIIIEEDTPVITSLDINGNSVSGSSATIDISWTGYYKGNADSYTYTVLLYNTRTNEVSERIVDSSTYTYTYTINKAGDYYAVVYGTASDGKSGKDYAGVEESPYYKKTSIIKYYSITIQFTNASWSGPSFVKEGDKFSGSLSTGSSYQIPNDMTVYMGDKLLKSGTDADYWFTGRTARTGSWNLYIPAEGDFKLTMIADQSSTGGGCLVKGTKILLANGISKKIEDVNYDDLLLVWDYELGKYTYQYPIWIEKAMPIDKYTRITFSDGSIIDVAINHGFYSYDLNLFVDVKDTKNFKVGTTVAKLNDNYELEKVKVKKIETIYEETIYYHIVSTRFYNVIANNILTTDDVVFVSNLYGFENNATWPNTRNELLKKTYLYSYKEFESFLPYYMYKGLRVEEGAILRDYINLEEFKYYLLTNQVNKDILSNPITNIKGKNIWMVTNSDDNILPFNKSKFMIEEGNYYKLPKPKKEKKFLYWYNTSNGQKYRIGDNIQIWHGTHFIAIYDK